MDPRTGRESTLSWHMPPAEMEDGALVNFLSFLEVEEVMESCTVCRAWRMQNDRAGLWGGLTTAFQIDSPNNYLGSNAVSSIRQRRRNTTR